MTKNSQVTFTVQDGQNVATLTQAITEVATGNDRQNVTQTIATSWTAINFRPVTPDLFMVQNLRPDNYVQLATANDGTGLFARVSPGRPGPYITADPGATYYARAHTAAVKIAILAAPV